MPGHSPNSHTLNSKSRLMAFCFGISGLFLILITMSGLVRAQEGGTSGTPDPNIPILVPSPGAGTPTATPYQPPPPVPYQWQSIADGFNSPVYLSAPHDGSGRLFVVEQDGVIFIIQNGKTIQQPFLDISSKLTGDVFQGGYTERGLLNLAFAPDYAQSGLFYIFYVDQQNETVLSRYKASADPNVADPSSEVKIMVTPHPFQNHMGAQLAFGPDGDLYIGMGDGGSIYDPQGNGQKTDTLLGKLLRIDVRKADPGQAYAIPTDNPFAGKAGYKPEIWAYGLRNPWRFSFDSQTGDLYIGDVGEARYEEVDYQKAGSPGGQNYGWSLFEGYAPFKPATNTADLGNISAPVYVYDHSLGCAIISGYVYRGKALPDLIGTYLFADYCYGRIWRMTPPADPAQTRWNASLWMDLNTPISSFGQDEAGELYAVGYKGAIYKLVPKS